MGTAIYKAVFNHTALHRKIIFFLITVFYLLMGIKENLSLLGSSICSSVLMNLKITFNEVITGKPVSIQMAIFVRNQKKKNQIMKSEINQKGKETGS